MSSALFCPWKRAAHHGPFAAGFVPSGLSAAACRAAVRPRLLGNGGRDMARKRPQKGAFGRADRALRPSVRKGKGRRYLPTRENAGTAGVGGRSLGRVFADGT